MHRARFGQTAALLLGMLALAAVTFAQGREGRPGVHRMPRGPRARPEEMRQAMRQMVIARMREALHLTEQQEAKVVPRFEELMQTRSDHAMKRRAAMARLRSLLLDGTAGDQEIARGIRDVRAIEEDYLRREVDLRSAIDASLTPRQQGRLVFFEGRIRRVVQRRMQEAMGEGPQRGMMPPGGRRQPPPDDSFDLPGGPEEIPQENER